MGSERAKLCTFNVCLLAGHPLVKVGLVYCVFKSVSWLLHVPALWGLVEDFTHFMTGTAREQDL